MFAALYLSLGADYLPFMLRANRRKGDSRLDEWAVNLRSAALVLASSQIAIIGFLNLLPLEKFRPFISRSLAYAMVVLFTILSYRFLAFADSEMQLGGGRPINCLGRPVSRRLVFVGLIVIASLILVGLRRDDANAHDWFLQPDFPFLVVILAAVICAALMAERYRRVPSSGAQFGRRISLGLIALIALHLLIGTLLENEVYMASFSSIALMCTGASAYSLTRARKMPDASSSVVA